MAPDAITVIIPSRDPDRPLRRCLESYRPQLAPDDEVLVVVDRHRADGDAWRRVVETVDSFGPQYRALVYDACRETWGHDALNWAFKQARRGTWLALNDDDDVSTPQALKTIRAGIASVDQPRPLCFRFLTHYGVTVGFAIEQGCVSGHCLVVPNLPGKVGEYSDRYEGDFDWVRDTLARWPEVKCEPVFRDAVIAVGRPKW